MPTKRDFKSATLLGSDGLSVPIDVDVALDGNTLFIDSSTNRVGIGTPTPSRQLEVYNTGSPTLRFNHNATSWDIRTNGTQGSALQFDYGGTAQILVKSDGKVGIGTTSPDRTIHEKVASRSTTFAAATGTTWHDMIIQNPNNTVGAATGIAFVLNSSWHENAGTGIAAVKASASSDYGADMVFITRPQSATAVERIRIKHDGKVGIGTTGPGTMLEVADTVTITATTGPNLLFEDSGGTNRGRVTYDSTSLKLRADSGYNLKLGCNNADVITLNTSGYFLFSGANLIGVNTSDGSDTSYLAVGAGSTETDGRGAIVRFYGNEHATNPGRLAISGGSSASAYIDFRTAGAERMRIDNSGNVFVGLTSTTGIYNGATSDNGAYIAGSVGAIVSQSNSNINYYAAKASGYSDSRFMIFQVAGAEVGRISVESGGLSIGTGSSGTRAININSSQYVGIGTASPDTLLHISGAPDSKVITFDQSGRASAIGTYFSSNGNDSRLDFFLSSGSTDGTSNHKMSLKANGHLGLGITSPQSVLTVVQSGGTLPSGCTNGIVLVNNNTTSLNSHLTLIGGNLGDSRIEFGDDGDRDIGMIRYVHNGNYMTFVTNTVSALTLDSSQNATFAGDVTVNSTSEPGVVVERNGSAYFKTSRTTSGTESTLFIGSATSYNQLISRDGSTGAKSFVFQMGTTERVRIDSSGNVGIGTSSPSTTFHVAGGSTFTPSSGENFVITRDSAGPYIGNSSNHLLRIITNNTERMRFDTSGHVGIGGAGTSGLSVAKEGSNTTDGAYFLVNSTNTGFGGGAVGAGFKYGASVGGNFYPFKITVGGTTINQIASTGVMYVGNGSTAYGSHDPYYTFTHDTNTGMDWAAADTLTFKTGGTERVRIDSSGNVGIGTTSPGAPLHLYGSNKAYIDWEETTSTTRWRWVVRSDNGNFQVQGITGASGQPLTIKKTDGYVGIGATSPVTPLEIRTTNKLGSTFTGTTNGEGLTVTQTNYTAGNYISLVEAAYDDGGAANPNVRIGAYFDGNGSKLVFGTSNNYSSGITNAALAIDSSGRINLGVNTSTSASGMALKVEATGNVQQLLKAGTNFNSSINFGDQDSDTSGQLLYAHNGNYMRFWVNGANAMRIDSSGTLIINDTARTLACALHVTFNGQTEQGICIENTVNNSSGAAVRFIDYLGSYTSGGIYFSAANSINYNTTSDYRLKENVVNLTNATERLKQIPVYRFNFKSSPDVTVDGFLAHEVSDHVPEAITGEKDAVDADGNPEYQGIDHSKLVPLLVATIKELEARITELENN